MVHPDCSETARECRLYSYVVDKHTQEIRPKILDKHNHYIDAIRYACALLIRKKNMAGVLVKKRHRRAH